MRGGMEKCLTLDFVKFGQVLPDLLKIYWRHYKKQHFFSSTWENFNRKGIVLKQKQRPRNPTVAVKNIYSKKNYNYLYTLKPYENLMYM